MRQLLALTLIATTLLSGQAYHHENGGAGGGTGANYGPVTDAFFTTAPIVLSGQDVTVTASNGTAAFTLDAGVTGTNHTITLQMPQAATGWNCHAENLTATDANRANQRVVQRFNTEDPGQKQRRATLQSQTVSTGAALAFTASDIVAVQCTAY